MIEALKEHRLMKRLAEINRENIPERTVFARGAGAIGHFRPYMSMRDYTSASFLCDPERETPVFVRFSKATGGSGSSETGRDLRGFAVKFYTACGNYDLISGSLPVFYTNRPAKLPELLAVLKKDKKSNLNCPERFWSFAAANPEVLHLVLHLYGSKGNIKSYRYMAGYSINTYLWRNNENDLFFVRYTWLPTKGSRSISRQEGEFLAGFDPDAVSRDLYEALKEGEKIEYELLVQMVLEEKSGSFDFDLTDATKLWPTAQIRPIKIGKMSLTNIPNDYLNDVEKAAFSPANLVKGIEFSTDPLLPSFTFSMEDEHRHRLGMDYEQLPVNRCLKPLEGEKEMPEDGDEDEVRGARSMETGQEKMDCFTQAGEYYRGLGEEERLKLEDNIGDDMMFIEEKIQSDMIRHLLRVDQGLGKRIAKRLAF